MKTGIIVPFYNGHQYIARLIESFDLALGSDNCTMFIIDNSPLYKSIDIPVTVKMQVEIVKEETGLGYGKACNRGYEICRERNYDNIIISNQDGYVSIDLIDDLLQPFKIETDILITAPILKTYENNQIEDFFVKYYLSQIPQYISDLSNGQPKSFYMMNRISGACFAMNLRNKLYQYPYLFDPLFHMYFEDEDLCYRVKQINGKIVMVSQGAIFYHQHAHTTDIENQESISAEKLVSEKIMVIKDNDKMPLKAFFGILVSTLSSFTYHIFRGELKKAYLHVRSFMIIFFRLPVILKARKRDIGIVRASKNLKPNNG